MRLASTWLSFALLVPILSSPSALAQDPDPGSYLYRFDLVLESGQSRIDVPVNGQVFIALRLRDLSRDGYTTYLPAGTPPVPSVNPLGHSVGWEITPEQADPGWTTFTPSSFISFAGQETVVDFPLQTTAQARSGLYPFNVTAVIATPDGGEHRATVNLLGFSLGPQSFAAQVSKSYDLQPKERTNIDVKLINLALLPRAFDMQVTQNSCGMLVATSTGNLVAGKAESTYPIGVEAPGNKPWYFSELCTLAIEVRPADNPDLVQQVFVSIQVNGGYVDPVWVFWTVAIILAIILIILLVARRKSRIEEEILGKPQKPWTIPVEVLYLKALRQKDERAWYVVRHHLMEEEYRSSLLWYKSYKKATKGARTKESLVLRQEKAYERWKKSWLKVIAKPLKEADRFEAKLQRKLDRKAAKQERKMAGKVRKVTRKMAAAHARQVERGLEKWQKQAKKAQKKGLAAPPRPVLPEPDYPEEPEVEPTPLAQHKWSKKAARFRARRVRKQGDLEVKFEKADARKLAKLRRKVQRLARKLDDPEFVKEHPLLKSDA